MDSQLFTVAVYSLFGSCTLRCGQDCSRTTWTHTSKTHATCRQMMPTPKKQDQRYIAI